MLFEIENSTHIHCFHTRYIKSWSFFRTILRNKSICHFLLFRTNSSELICDIDTWPLIDIYQTTRKSRLENHIGKRKCNYFNICNKTCSCINSTYLFGCIEYYASVSFVFTIATIYHNNFVILHLIWMKNGNQMTILYTSEI